MKTEKAASAANYTYYDDADTAPVDGILQDGKHVKTARVLLIEDDRVTRRMVSAALKSYCNIIEAPDASQGITLYNHIQPDIVFLDIELPDGSGQDMLKWMMHNDPAAFVVMFTGHTDNNNVMKSLDLGARGFVSKPFDVQRMLYFIERCPKLH